MDAISTCLIGIGLCLVAIFVVLARYAVRTTAKPVSKAGEQSSTPALGASARNSRSRPHSHLPSTLMTSFDDSSFRDTDAAVYVSSWPADVLTADDGSSSGSSSNSTD